MGVFWVSALGCCFCEPLAAPCAWLPSFPYASDAFPKFKARTDADQPRVDRLPTLSRRASPGSQNPSSCSVSSSLASPRRVKVSPARAPSSPSRSSAEIDARLRRSYLVLAESHSNASLSPEPSLDTAIRRRSNPPSLSLDFASLDSASSRAILPDASSVASSTISSTYAPPARSLSPPPAPVRQSSSDPWASASTPNFAALSSHSTAPFGSLSEHPGGGHGDSRSYPSSLHASPPAVRGGLLAIPRWWEKEIRISVRLVPEREGKWPGLKWTVYEIETAGGRSVKRRFSEFVCECSDDELDFRDEQR